MDSRDTDVVVAGAGPAGLMTAAELRLGGARVVVLDRLPAPSGQSRGLGFTARAMETFDQRGLLPLFGEVTTSAEGHFGGMRFDYGVLPGAHFGARGIPQARTEAVLEKWALTLGADLRRGWDVRDLAEDAAGVEVAADTPDGPRRLRAAHLVGADGGHSTVRKLAGFSFPGTPASRLMYLADVAGCRIPPRFLGERVPGGMVMAAPLGPDTDRIIVVEDGRSAEGRAQPTFAELAAIWLRLTGEDISAGRPEWVGSFTDTTRLATSYRRGRVLLVGDAAHVHLPAGGQGLSTGVQDAANLGWKLAGTVRGWAPPGLLDTYHGERHPVGVRLLMNTRAQGALFVGSPELDPVRALFRELMAHDGVRAHLAGIVSGLDVRYDLGPGDHPLLGRRLPPAPLLGASSAASTTELLHAGRGVLLDLGLGPAGRAAAAGRADRLTVVAARPGPGADPGVAGAGGLLVRPDGHVAWAGTDPADGLAAAVTRWFGRPTAA